MTTDERQVRRITLTVRDRPGVLARVVGQFARRNLNIDSLVAQPVEPGVTGTIIVVFMGSEREAARLKACLLRFLDVLDVGDLDSRRTLDDDTL